MPFKMNVLTGQLDLVSSAGNGNVNGIPPTDINAIARWDDTTGTTIKNSPGTYIQNSGAIEAQAFITNRNVIDEVIVDSGQTWLAPNLNIELTGSIVIEADGEVVIL